MAKKTKITAEKGETTILIERAFDAAPELVFSLYEDPHLFVQWAKPENVALELERMECRTGGSFLFHHQHPGGIKFSFYGVYHEVIPPKSIIRTSEFKGLPEKLLPVVENLQFEPVQGQKTLLTMTIYCPNEKYRDGMVGSGMQAHFDHSFALLDHLLNENGAR